MKNINEWSKTERRKRTLQIPLCFICRQVFLLISFPFYHLINGAFFSFFVFFATFIVLLTFHFDSMIEYDVCWSFFSFHFVCCICTVMSIRFLTSWVYMLLLCLYSECSAQKNHHANCKRHLWAVKSANNEYISQNW